MYLCCDINKKIDVVNFYFQEVTRSHKGWALDSVVLQNLITKLNREEVHEGPAEGVYVHGLFLEGTALAVSSSLILS